MSGILQKPRRVPDKAFRKEMQALMTSPIGAVAMYWRARQTAGAVWINGQELAHAATCAAAWALWGGR